MQCDETDKQLQEQIRAASDNPLIDGLLKVAGGLLAVLNERREVLALNYKFLETVGVSKAEEILGLRLGEALRCTHAEEGICGKMTACSTCGANNSILAGLSENQPSEKLCSLQTKCDGKQDLYLRIRCCPITLSGVRLSLIFMQDITRQQQSRAAERVFFHDINNLLTCLIGVSDLLIDAEDHEIPELTAVIHRSIRNLAQDVKIQQCLINGSLNGYQGDVRLLSAGEVLDDLGQLFSNHPLSRERLLRIEPEETACTFTADPCLLNRILGNMVTNALEATKRGGEVRVHTKCEKKKFLLFSVWNDVFIPPAIAKRIFQRNFSTKEIIGRGLGTYSMKQLGEGALGGQVGFITSETAGTTFFLRLPLPGN